MSYKYRIKRFKIKRDRKKCWINYSGEIPASSFRTHVSGKFDNFCCLCNNRINKFRTFYGVGFSFPDFLGNVTVSSMIYSGRKKTIYYDAVCSNECATMFILRNI
jgi:hypothetical protein